MGLGDVKLALSLGTALGWSGWVVTVYGVVLGTLLGGVFNVGALLARRVRRKTDLPHGPFMVVGTLLTVLYFG
jgi:leader peptidase (prepilin peptidase)/N-methyltransferase